jgi:hypothetical protein
MFLFQFLLLHLIFPRRGEKIDELMVEVFIQSYATPPPPVVLDVDTTDDPVHGHQEGAIFSRVLRRVLLFAVVYIQW